MGGSESHVRVAAGAQYALGSNNTLIRNVCTTDDDDDTGSYVVGNNNTVIRTSTNFSGQAMKASVDRNSRVTIQTPGGHSEDYTAKVATSIKVCFIAADGTSESITLPLDKNAISRHPETPIFSVHIRGDVTQINTTVGEVFVSGNVGKATSNTGDMIVLGDVSVAATTNGDISVIGAVDGIDTTTGTVHNGKHAIRHIKDIVQAL